MLVISWVFTPCNKDLHAGLTNPTEQSPSEACTSTTQEIPCVSREPNAHRRVHKTPPLDGVLAHASPVRTFPSYKTSEFRARRCSRQEEIRLQFLFHPSQRNSGIRSRVYQHVSCNAFIFLPLFKKMSGSKHRV